MKFARKATAGWVDAEINLTSLIDIMFNLVLFFVVTTSFSTDSGIQVKLPPATAKVAEETKKLGRVAVTVREDGRVYLGEKQVDESTLEKELTETAKKNPDILVIIRADQSVLHGRVVSIMDIARRAGLKRLAIATIEKTVR